MPVILQTRLPEFANRHAGLARHGGPAGRGLVLMDEAYAPQMAYREALASRSARSGFYQKRGRQKPAVRAAGKRASQLLAALWLWIDTNRGLPDGR